MPGLRPSEYFCFLNPTKIIGLAPHFNPDQLEWDRSDTGIEHVFVKKTIKPDYHQELFRFLRLHIWYHSF
jgi:hypothetical protein